MKTRFFLMLTAGFMLSLSSCMKDEAKLDESAINLADDDVVSDAVFEDVFSTADNASIIVDNLAKGGDSKSEVVLADSCPSITVSKPGVGLWPRIVTVDYGTGCTGFYDATRSGKIIIEVTGPRTTVGSKRTVTFNNYYFNGIKVEGTKVLENKGLNNNQNPLVSVKLTGGKLTLLSGKTIERSFDHQREWVAGFGTKNIWDDECLITGTAAGKSPEGVSYNNTIMTALRWTRAC